MAQAYSVLASLVYAEKPATRPDMRLPLRDGQVLVASLLSPEDVQDAARRQTATSKPTSRRSTSASSSTAWQPFPSNHGITRVSRMRSDILALWRRTFVPLSA